MMQQSSWMQQSSGFGTTCWNFFPPKLFPPNRGVDFYYFELLPAKIERRRFSVRERPSSSCHSLHDLPLRLLHYFFITDSIHLHQPALPIDHPTASVRNSSSIIIHVRQPPPSAVDSSFAYTLSTSINNNF